jgi:hypothetical protein
MRKRLYPMLNAIHTSHVGHSAHSCPLHTGWILAAAVPNLGDRAASPSSSGRPRRHAVAHGRSLRTQSLLEMPIKPFHGQGHRLARTRFVVEATHVIA